MCKAYLDTRRLQTGFLYEIYIYIYVSSLLFGAAFESVFLKVILKVIFPLFNKIK